MRISDWSSDVCSSDLDPAQPYRRAASADRRTGHTPLRDGRHQPSADSGRRGRVRTTEGVGQPVFRRHRSAAHPRDRLAGGRMAGPRSEEHTSELQSLMRISYAVFCLKKKKTKQTHNITCNIK